MTDYVQSQQSAEILSFPAGGRAGFKKNVDRSLQMMASTPRAVNVMSGSGWYHDVAMQDEAKQPS